MIFIYYFCLVLIALLPVVILFSAVNYKDILGNKKYKSSILSYIILLCLTTLCNLYFYNFKRCSSSNINFADYLITTESLIFCFSILSIIIYTVFTLIKFIKSKNKLYLKNFGIVFIVLSLISFLTYQSYIETSIKAGFLNVSYKDYVDLKLKSQAKSLIDLHKGNEFDNIKLVDEIFSTNKEAYNDKINYKKYGGYEKFVKTITKNNEQMCKNNIKDACINLTKLYIANKDYKKVHELSNKLHNKKYYNIIEENDIQAYILENENDKALKLLEKAQFDSITKPVKENIYKSIIYTNKGDYKKALQSAENIPQNIGCFKNRQKAYIYHEMKNNKGIQEEFNYFKSNCKNYSNYTYNDFISNIDYLRYIKDLQNIYEYKSKSKNFNY